MENSFILSLMASGMFGIFMGVLIVAGLSVPVGVTISFIGGCLIGFFQKKLFGKFND